MSHTILLIDDEDSLREVLGKRLGKRGYRILSASGGEQALGMLQADPEIRVALLDIRMPGMDGIETMHRLRRQFPSVAVIILTGHGTPLCRLECGRWGARAFFTKPVEIDDLFRAIEKCCTPGIVREKETAGQNA